MMNIRKFVMRQTVFMARCHIPGILLQAGLFLLLGRFDLSVILGALAGAVLATANHSVMVFTSAKAAEMARMQDVAGGKKLVQVSYALRMVGLIVILCLCALLGIFNLVALVLPQTFNRPILMIAQKTGKAGVTGL